MWPLHTELQIISILSKLFSSTFLYSNITTPKHKVDVRCSQSHTQYSTGCWIGEMKKFALTKYVNYNQFDLNIIYDGYTA